MNDFALFFVGCFVTAIVAAAVGFLMWGAANEPHAAQDLDTGDADSSAPRSVRDVAPASSDARVA